MAIKRALYFVYRIALGVAGVFFLLIFLGSCVGCLSLIRGSQFNISEIKYPVKKDSILVMTLKGIIYDETDFLDNLNHYTKDEKIKGILIRIDSPGGLVGASQETYSEILRLKKKYKKPVYFSVGGLGASGAFYITLSGDKVFVNASSMVGSVGVIRSFMNYEKLQEWAKIKSYSIKTGLFKDTGSPSRQMTLRERAYVQNLMQDHLNLFKTAIIKGRKLSKTFVDSISDGRVFVGSTAKKLGLVDAIGTYYEALSMIGQKTGLGAEPEVFKPMKKKPFSLPYLARSFFLSLFSLESLAPSFETLDLRAKLRGQPLYIMPEFIGSL